MLKIFFISILCAISLTSLISCSTHKDNISTNELHQNIVGGWSPMFFDVYDTNKIQSIVSIANKNKIKTIHITYELKNQKLAYKIYDAIIHKTQIKPQINEIKLTDTPDLKYNHSIVIVTLYYSK